MSRYFFIALTVLTAAMAGCTTKHPQTAQEFRIAIPKSMMGKLETFEVKRPFRAVAKTFRNRAPKCLNVAIKTRSMTNGSYSAYTSTYTPTVVVKRRRAELHVQKHIDNVVKVSEEPAGGYYLLVVDAYPINRTTTRIDIYRPAMGHGVLIKAIKAWAAGTSKGCPDLTKI